MKSGQIDAWVAPSAQATGTIKPGDATSIVQNTFSLDNFTAWAVRQGNQPLIDALNAGLDAVIADGTYAKLYADWEPRSLPPGWKPGSKAAPLPQLPDFAKIAAEHKGRRPRRPRRNRRWPNFATPSSTGPYTARPFQICSRPVCRIP